MLYNLLDVTGLGVYIMGAGEIGASLIFVFLTRHIYRIRYVTNYRVLQLILLKCSYNHDSVGIDFRRQNLTSV